LELEENILRYKLSIREHLHFEWSWQEEKSRGGMDCTILAHIETGTNALSTRNKRHLHWKVLDPAHEMNNDIKFATPTHNLLRKTEIGNTVRQAHRNSSISLLASPQVARKKGFTKLNLALMITSRQNTNATTPTGKEAENRNLEPSLNDNNRTPGSIGPPAARNELTYD
jgi:hypothetical protein